MRKVDIPERTSLSQPSTISVVEASTRLDYLSRVTIENKVEKALDVRIVYSGSFYYDYNTNMYRRRE